MSYSISNPISRALLLAGVVAQAAGLCLAIGIAFFILAPLQSAILRAAPRYGGGLPRLFYRAVLRLVKVRVVACGRPPGELAALVVANHVSWTDIPALGALFPACFVAKREVGRWPVVRTFARLVDTVFVDRNDRTSIPRTNAAMLGRMRAGKHVVLFPEGTTHADGPQAFHSAHFAVAEELSKLGPGYAVQPIAIRYSAPAAAWIGDDALVPHILRLMRSEPITCEVIFCAPLQLDTPMPRRTIAEACSARIAAAYQGRPI